MSDLSIKERWLVLHIKQLKDKVERLQSVVDRLADDEFFIEDSFSHCNDEFIARIEYAAKHATEDKS